jgi:hypothetical protein
MRLVRCQFLQVAAGAVALPAISRIARAQIYPTRTVTMIVPNPGGGGPTLPPASSASTCRIRSDRPSSFRFRSLKWVKRRSRSRSAPLPFCPRERTSPIVLVMSEKGQDRT